MPYAIRQHSTAADLAAIVEMVTVGDMPDTQRPGRCQRRDHRHGGHTATAKTLAHAWSHHSRPTTTLGGPCPPSTTPAAAESMTAAIDHTPTGHMLTVAVLVVIVMPCWP